MLFSLRENERVHFLPNLCRIWLRNKQPLLYDKILPYCLRVARLEILNQHIKLRCENSTKYRSGDKGWKTSVPALNNEHLSVHSVGI